MYYMMFKDDPESNDFLVMIRICRDTSWFDDTEGLFPGEVQVLVELTEASRPFPWIDDAQQREIMNKEGRGEVFSVMW